MNQAEMRVHPAMLIWWIHDIYLNEIPADDPRPVIIIPTRNYARVLFG